MILNTFLANLVLNSFCVLFKYFFESCGGTVNYMDVQAEMLEQHALDLKNVGIS